MCLRANLKGGREETDSPKTCFWTTISPHNAFTAPLAHSELCFQVSHPHRAIPSHIVLSHFKGGGSGSSGGYRTIGRGGIAARHCLLHLFQSSAGRQKEGLTSAKPLSCLVFVVYLRSGVGSCSSQTQCFQPVVAEGLSSNANAVITISRSRFSSSEAHLSGPPKHV